MTVAIVAGLVGGFLLLLHLVGVGVVSRRLLRHGRRGTSPAPDASITVIRPICGSENNLEATLGSTFRIKATDCEIIFCIADARDPAIPLVRRLMALYPDVDARLLVGNETISANPKLNNVVKGWRAARHDWIAMADSNVLMPPDYLSRLMAAWSPGTGLVCSPPIGCRPDGVWAELECAFLNTYQARWQCVADAFEFGFAQGKTMLFRRDILDAHGGLAALGAEPAEDAAATKLIRNAGLKVRVVDAPFDQPLGQRSFAEVWGRQLRWARLRRETFPWLYALELLTGIVPSAVATSIFTTALDGPVAASLIALTATWYAAEAALAAIGGWHLSWRSPVASILRDLLIPVLWMGSWIGNDFVWRGTAMTVADQDGVAR